MRRSLIVVSIICVAVATIWSGSMWHGNNLNIHCKSKILPSGQGDVTFLDFHLSLETPCPNSVGVIKVLGTIGSLESKEGSINLNFLTEGNISIVGGQKTYNIMLSNLPSTKNVDIQITGPGMGLLSAGVNLHIDGKDIVGTKDTIFFLLADDGDFIVSQSSYFELEREKLKDDLQAGIIDKSRYNVEINKVLEGKHTYVCAQITCY